MTDEACRMHWLNRHLPSIELVPPVDCAQAIASTGLIDVSATCLSKAHSYIHNSQVRASCLSPVCIQGVPGPPCPSQVNLPNLVRCCCIGHRGGSAAPVRVLPPPEQRRVALLHP